MAEQNSSKVPPAPRVLPVAVARPTSPHGELKVPSSLERMTAHSRTSDKQPHCKVSLLGEFHPTNRPSVRESLLPGNHRGRIQQPPQQHPQQAPHQQPQQPQLLPQQHWQRQAKKRQATELHDPRLIFGNGDFELQTDEVVADERFTSCKDAPADRTVTVGNRIDQALGWLWNNTYFSFVPLYHIMSDSEVAQAILTRLSLPVLHRCCLVSTAFKAWAMAEIRTRPVVVLLGGLTKSWAIVDRPICLDFPVDDNVDWWQTGKCNTARTRCGAVGLSKRRVLIAGGLSCKSTKVEQSAELLDPYNMIWNTVPSMLQPRLSFGCDTLGAAGTRVIVTGGAGEGSDADG